MLEFVVPLLAFVGFVVGGCDSQKLADRRSFTRRGVGVEEVPGRCQEFAEIGGRGRGSQKFGCILACLGTPLVLPLVCPFG